jgi:peroxiredoxin Q/BCP
MRGASSSASGAGSQPAAVGSAAPSFTLPDQDGKPVSLADFAGRWVVLYFYPKDDGAACTVEATEFTEVLGQFEASGATVLGVSPDSPLSHRFFREKRGLRLTLLSDTDHATTRRYGAWREANWNGRTVGRVVRTTFLVDPSGHVAWRWDDVIPNGHAVEVGRKLQQMVVRWQLSQDRPQCTSTTMRMEV